MKRKIVNEITGRKKMTKRMRALAGVLGLTLCLGLTACGKNTDDEQKKESTKNDTEIGTIHVGTDGAYYPYCYLDEEDNELKGFEIDVLTEVGKRAGVDMDIEVVKWQGVFGMLDSGKIDTIACQMSITDERKESVDFSDGYYESGSALVVNKDDDSISDFDDLKGKVAACKEGTTGQLWCEDHADEYGFETTVYPDSVSMMMAVANKQADFLIEDYPVISYQIKIGEQEDLKVAIDAIEEAPQNGFAVKKGENADLLKMFNEGLQKIRDNGKYDEIIAEYE
mgnify:CR=1 FL=1